MIRSDSNTPLSKIFPLLLVLFLTAGCSSKTMVVLLSNPDGTTGAVNVSNSTGAIDITTANKATTISDRQSSPTAPVTMEKQEIDALFSQALLAQPKPPAHFILYFISNSSMLTEDSGQTIPAIMQAIEDRKSIDISIVGHSDTVGSDDYNYTISKGRAEEVARLLVSRGVMASHINTSSHGEGNPLVQTGDNISEPRNRRVEVIVR